MKNIILKNIGLTIILEVVGFITGACVGAGLLVGEKFVYFVEDKRKEKKNKKL